MDDLQLNAEQAGAVSQLSPRRVELLLRCLTFPGAFTATDLRTSSYPLNDENDQYLSRDLSALETGQLLTADPPRAAARQGRTISFRVAPLALSLFPDLSELTAKALSARR